MTFEEFKKIVSEVAFVGLKNYASSYSNGGDGFCIEDGFIIQRHFTGGAEGGNCWGGEARRFSNSTSPQPFMPLDAILKAVSPDISYLKYRDIESLIVESEECDHEYYGNYREYLIFKLDIKQLYNMMFPIEGK